MTTGERAVRKASHERLLRDFAQAAREVSYLKRTYPEREARHAMLRAGINQTSRTRYACFMTAFGQ
jgi:hypothetical protein